jgi:hypothetical protein
VLAPLVQTTVPSGRLGPEYTVTSADASPTLIVTVPGATAVNTGGSAVDKDTTSVSLDAHVAPVTSSPLIIERLQCPHLAHDHAERDGRNHGCRAHGCRRHPEHDRVAPQAALLQFDHPAHGSSRYRHRHLRIAPRSHRCKTATQANLSAALPWSKS